MTTTRTGQMRGKTAGLPTNDGSFKATERAESGVTLTLDPADVASMTDVEIDRLVDGYFDTTADDDLAAVHTRVQQAYDSARHWESRKGVYDRSRGVVESDDMAQEALLAVLEREANGHVIEDAKGYMHTFAWGIAQQAGNLGVRQEDRKALKMYNTAVDRKAAALGRRLTSPEMDEIAAEIRENWHDQRRKPSVDFRRYAGQMETSINGFETNEAADHFLSNNARTLATGTSGDFAPGGYADRAMHAADENFKDGGDLHDAKRMLWNALAEVGDDEVPMVSPGSLSQRKITAAKAVMKDSAGGIMGAVDTWEHGETNAATEALFAPFGEDPATRDAVCAQMRRFPFRATELWDSALRLANTRNAGKDVA